MKKKIKSENIKASVLIANYNNQQFLDECILSLKKQTYKNIEIIIHDDFSSDNSVQTIKKYKNIKLIKNKIRTKYASLNQLRAYERAFKISKGEIIFFLDSDDFFHRSKIKKILNHFELNQNLISIFDLPIHYDKKKLNKIKNKKKLYENYWPYIPPQSCISFRRDSLKEVFKKIKLPEYYDIWMDFRIAMFLKYLKKNYFILNENLTFYRQSENTISSKFNKYSINWWKRRMQAHNYIKKIFKMNYISYQGNLDFYLTKLINFFLK